MADFWSAGGSSVHDARDEMVEIYHQACRPACARCRGELGFSTIQQGAFKYHPECFAG
jgi:hypothetical protein